MLKKYFTGLTLSLILGVVFLSAQTWSPSTRLTWNMTSSTSPAIAADSGSNIYITWFDEIPGNFEIYLKKSSNSGSNWSALKRITWTTGTSSNPDIAIDSSNNIYLAWNDATSGNPEIYFKSSTNFASTWSSVKRLTWSTGESYSPVIAVDSNNHLHVVWLDNTPGSYELYHKKSTDGGSNWGSNQRLTWNLTFSSAHDFTIDTNDNLHVVWSNYFASNNEIYYKKSINGGSSWSSTKRLTWNAGYSYMPAIASDSSNNIHVVWYDGTPGNMEIFYKKSIDNGNTWSAVTRLTWTSSSSVEPDLIVDSCDYLHLVWADTIQTNKEIFYKTSMNGGNTWSAVTRLTWTTGFLGYPCITEGWACSLHVAWQYYVSSNYEIYYKKK